MNLAVVLPMVLLTFPAEILDPASPETIPSCLEILRDREQPTALRHMALSIIYGRKDSALAVPWLCELIKDKDVGPRIFKFLPSILTSLSFEYVQQYYLLHPNCRRELLHVMAEYCEGNGVLILTRFAVLPSFQSNRPEDRLAAYSLASCSPDHDSKWYRFQYLAIFDSDFDVACNGVEILHRCRECSPFTLYMCERLYRRATTVQEQCQIIDALQPVAKTPLALRVARELLSSSDATPVLTSALTLVSFSEDKALSLIPVVEKLTFSSDEIVQKHAKKVHKELLSLKRKGL